MVEDSYQKGEVDRLALPMDPHNGHCRATPSTTLFFKKHMEKISMKRLLIICGLVLFSTSSAIAAHEGEPDATLTLKATSVSPGFGTTSGEGTLTFKGHSIPFTIRGFSLGELGIAKVEATGKVYGLKNLEQFSGRYFEKKAEISVGVGAGLSALQNETTGVHVDLKTEQTGIKLSAAFGGARFTLDPEVVAKLSQVDMGPKLSNSVKALADVCGCPMYVNVYWSTYESDPMAKKRSVGYAIDQFVSSATTVCKDVTKRENFCKNVAQVDVLFDDKNVSSMMKSGDTLKVVSNERGTITPEQLADILVQ